MTGRSLLLAACLLLQACSAGVTPVPLPSQPQPVTASPPPPRLEPFLARVRNAEYPLGAVDVPRSVRLSDGRYAEGSSSADTLIVTMTDFLALGDLDADGIDEAAALVAEQYGGAVTYYFLVVYENDGGEPLYAASAYLDDRPLIYSLSIGEGKIEVQASVHTINDPTCCPSLRGVRRYVWHGPNLILTYYATQTPGNQARVITIEAPLEGAQVSGMVRLKGSVSIAPFENTLVYRILDMGGVELSAGPVSVTSSQPGAVGTFETAIDLGRILSNTTIRLVVQDLSPADGSLLAMDSVVLQVR
ncbi:MAG: hypothetical protein Fur0043_04570 [Anaerolineales bacterium]